MPASRSFNIAVYPGDGIGPEVMEQALRVLAAVQPHHAGFVLNTRILPWGVAYWEQNGVIAPPDYLDQLRAFDAIYLGALGWPAKVPDHLTIEPIIRMRQSFDQYACVRPAHLYPGVPSPLAGKTPADIDILVIRENSQGEYVAAGGRVRRGTREEVAVETAIHTRLGVERILRFGFERARTRRRHLTMITKSNALKHGMVMWDEVLEAVRADYPEITAERQHVDAAAMNFVRGPERFDVVVASNLFGDMGLVARGDLDCLVFCHTWICVVVPSGAASDRRTDSLRQRTLAFCMDMFLEVFLMHHTCMANHSIEATQPLSRPRASSERVEDEEI